MSYWTGFGFAASPLLARSAAPIVKAALKTAALPPPVSVAVRAVINPATTQSTLDNQLQAAQDAQTQAETMAATAQAADAVWSPPPPPPPSFMDQYGQWLWLGAAGVAVVMIVAGFALTRKKPSTTAGYRRRRRTR